MMTLTDLSALNSIDTLRVNQFMSSDLAELEAFYKASYPGNWFDTRMLKTGYYYGVRENAEIMSVSGMHVYSPRYGVAELGNITSRPDVCGRGLATISTAWLVKALVDHIHLQEVHKMEIQMAQRPGIDYGRCPCGGIYTPKLVEVNFGEGDLKVTITNVPQGACPNCGSLVYKANVLECIETLFKS
jgi:hypothetical protein